MLRRRFEGTTALLERETLNAEEFDEVALEARGVGSPATKPAPRGLATRLRSDSWLVWPGSESLPLGKPASLHIAASSFKNRFLCYNEAENSLPLFSASLL